MLQDNHPHKIPPPVKLAPYLLEYSFELGLFKNGAMGMTPLDWVDVSAWVSLMNVDLHPEEIKILRELSYAFVSWTNKAKEQNCPAPYGDELTATVKSANIKEQMKRFRQGLKK